MANARENVNATVCLLYDVFRSRNLQAEYDMLKQAKEEQPTEEEEDLENKDAEMIAEAKLLRQHKGRLEARMHILEDHNRQLELQLQRLRQLLEQVGTWSGQSVVWSVQFYSMVC